MAKEFCLGTTVCTKGIDEKIKAEEWFSEFVKASFLRFRSCDWGDICDEDKQQNDQALIDGERILGSYSCRGIKIWIITEWDRSYTTILFPEEY